jgi:hypothetical protein
MYELKLDNLSQEVTLSLVMRGARGESTSAKRLAVKGYIYFGCCAQNKRPVMAGVIDLIQPVET